jgi:hypothetical protein
MRCALAFTALLAACHCPPPASAPATTTLDLTGGWSAAQYQPIVDTTQEVTLAADLSALTDGERAAVAKLREAGEIFQQLYEDQLHRQAGAARAALAAYTGPEAEAWRTLYRIFMGPIAVTLENERVAFLPVDPVQPGKTVYPWGITKDEIEQFLAAHPEARASLLAPRTAC